MDSHNFNFLPRKSGFGFSSYLDTNYLARSFINNRKACEDPSIQFQKMDMKSSKVSSDQTCPFFSKDNLVNRLEGFSRRNTCQIKNYKQIGVLPQDHVSVMPICSSFLIGGYVGSKSQKENAHRTRNNVQIQDFFINKIVDFVGNAVQSVTKCSKGLEKTGAYMFDEGKNSGRPTIEFSKSIKESVTEQNNPSAIGQNIRMKSDRKQSYAEVTKTTMNNTVPEYSLNKPEEKQFKTKAPMVEPVTESKTHQFIDFKTKCAGNMTKLNTHNNHNPRRRPRVNISLNNFIIDSDESCNSLDTLYFRKNRQRERGKDKVKYKSTSRDMSRSGINLSKYKKPIKATELCDKEKSNCLIGLSEVLNEISIPILERSTGIDFMPNNNKQKTDHSEKVNLEGAVIINCHSSEKSPIEGVLEDSIFFDLSPKNYCDVALGNITYRPNNISVELPLASKQDINQNRNRAISECSIDSEDSFIVFSYDCDRCKDNDEESDDSVWNDDSCFSDDGYCDKACCITHNHNKEDKVGSYDGSKKTEEKPKKKVKFANEKSLVQVHRMVAWDYAYRMARIGPWETYVRDSARFRTRICQLGAILSSVLDIDHRKRIFQERFSF